MPTVYGAGTAGTFYEIMSVVGFNFIAADVAADSIFDDHRLFSNVR